jgi:hypothetical protein
MQKSSPEAPNMGGKIHSCQLFSDSNVERKFLVLIEK